MWGRISGSVIGYLLFGPAGIFVGHLIGVGSEELLKKIFPDLPEKVAGAVGDTLIDLVNERFKKTKEALDKLESTERRQIGYELQTAFRDALCEALYDVGGEKCFRKEWRNKREVPSVVVYPLTPQGNQLWRKKDPLAKQVCWCLDAMVKAVKAQQLLPLEPPVDKPGAMVSSYLNAETPRTLNEAFFTQVIAPYLNEYKALLDELPDFKQHLHSYLLDRTLTHLGNLLKQRPEVWRTFLRLMLEDLRTDMLQLGIGQQETLKRLDELLDKSRGAISLADLGKAVADLMTAIGNVEKHQDERLDELVTRVVKQHGEIIDHLNEALAGIKRVEYKLTEVGVDVQTIFPLLQEILNYVRGASLEEFTTQADRLIVRSRTASVMLRERQANYLERHHLFAGRSKEMGDIYDFLQKQRHGYIFVTGLSGYGKTALLANLISRARERYVWYFLNQLDNTHRRKDFLRQMCEQLLVYYQVPVQSEDDLPDNVDRLEALYSQLLRMPLVQADQPLILVIDGIDEAEDEFINDLYIPRNLPDGKFIIFSARQVEQEDSNLKRDYPTRLGLSEDKLLPIELKALDRTGIVALVREAGGNDMTWADDPTKVDHVERVSEGDPFYLHYLIEDIVKGKITLEQIVQMPRGLDHYLDSWWSQVVNAMDETNLQNLMGILMIAVGPLPRDDLFHLYPEMVWTFDKILKQVRRFVFTGKVVSREKGEQVAYSLCHWRFRDYIAQKKLPEMVAMYQKQMLDYCAHWQDHDSLYALQFFSTHLLKSGRFREVLSLVDEPFLKEKIRHLQSYTSVLTDFKNAMHAAAAFQDRAKLLGLALAYNGLQEKAVQLADSGVIPLYARFGKPELALELTGMISDETERAKTRIAMAKELLSSQPDLAYEIVHQVLANWRSYSASYTLGEILVRVFALLPEELITFLEELDDFSPISSLVHFITQPAAMYIASFEQVLARLDPSLQERYRAMLIKALSIGTLLDGKSQLLLLLVWLEPDPNKAAAFVESEAARIITQAKRERLEQPDGNLTEQTIDRTIHLLLTEEPTFDEREALLRQVATSHVDQFLTAIPKGVSATLLKEGDKGKVTWASKKLRLIRDLGGVLADELDVGEAKKLLYAYLKGCEEVARLMHVSQDPYYRSLYDQRGYEEVVRIVHANHNPILLWERISKTLAAKNIQAALDFLKLPEIVTLCGDRWCWRVCSILESAAEKNLEAVLPILKRECPGEWEWFLESEGWTLIAKERARVDLEQALTIWREHIHKIDKSKILIDILYNAPPELHQRAIDELERNFTLEPRHQLYKVPILLDIALRLKQDRPGIAKATAVSTLDIIGERFEKEKRGRLEQSLFLVRIIPELAACDPSLISKAANLVDKIDDKFYYGLKLIPAADLLRLLVKRRDVPSLRYSYRVSQSTGMGDGDIVRDAPPLTDRPLLEDETIEGLNVEIALWHWKRHSREPVLGMLFEYEKWLSETSSALLINLYFLYQVRKGTLDFHTDYIKALLAIKTFPLYSTDVLDFVNLIENEDVRQLTFVDLYHKLPFAMIAQIDGFSRRALQAIAQVRIAARVFHPQRKQKYLDDALMEAEQSLKELQDDFTLDLLIQFVREVRHLDIEQATQLSEQFAIRVIDEVLKIPRAWVDDWKVEQLFELGDCGYHFSSEECTNIQRRSDQWLDKLEMQVEANTEERHYQLSSRLILMAYSTVSANRKRSLALIERATRHVSFLHEKGMRMVQQQRILRFLLASGEASLLEKAVWFSLDGGDLIFNAFDLFGSTLLKMEQEDKELPLRLREVIEWAEQLWRI